nr:3-hydroxylacyl-ACP dehydratase [Kibdelosporangium sp. MJ126-NF4]CEL17435.1 3-hydroxyacyl-[acyl-carrier-protein] dehydratase, FabZ form [Kibdelosporangium sp. MJ126-NF4]CTQ91338.1 3-hydroxyacyl-[acyl-carrier-protein] dehydratase, FabZ form (EC 4.2.1.59) [Kibdelosporangium sp. MJ126-NF4]
MRFHLVDRIDAIEPLRMVLARKLTSRMEDFWRDEGRGPEMPAPLVLESLCQAGSWLAFASTGRRAVLLSVDVVAFLAPVRPGDVLGLRGVVESIDEERAALSGTASVEGEVVMRADTILCALRPADELEDVEALGRMYEQLVRGAS